MIDARVNVLGLDRNAFLGFDGLVQAVAQPSSGHHPSGELVDEDDAVVADNVVLVLLEILVGAQRLRDVMDDRRRFRVVERLVLWKDALGTQPLLDEFVSRIGEGHVPGLFVERVVLLGDIGNETVNRVVELRPVLGGAGNDQGGAGLVDQDRVNLIHDREVVSPLDHPGKFGGHVVPEVIESEFVVRRVGYVGKYAARLLSSACDGTTTPTVIPSAP